MSTTTDALVADEVDVRGTIETTARRWWRREFDEQAPAALVDLLAAAVEPYVGTLPAGDSFAERRVVQLNEDIEQRAEEVKQLTAERDEARADRDTASAQVRELVGVALGGWNSTSSSAAGQVADAVACLVDAAEELNGARVDLDAALGWVKRLVEAATDEWLPDLIGPQVDKAESLIKQTVGRLDELVEEARVAAAQRDAVAEASAGGLTAETGHVHRYGLDEHGFLPCSCGAHHPDQFRALDEIEERCDQDEAAHWQEQNGFNDAQAKRQPHYWHLIDGDECTCESTEDGDH